MTDVPEDEQPLPEPEAQTLSRRRWPFVLLGLLLALLGWNAVITIPVSRALSDEEGSTTVAYRRWLISPNQIVFDVWSVDGSQSMVAMDRRLFKAAEALKDSSYESVVLAYHGQTRLLMDGKTFQEIGANRQTENPIYTMRTMQEHIYNPDGSPAFGTWTGGWLGVMGKQLEDHNEFHKRWWVNDAIGSAAAMPNSATAQ
ncbi:MAG: hypothetical protein WCL10_00030 [Novosphingobium sp.]|uniref:hypothetical protein n=1 Tax=Novosphingobium sp. TaxID=1874826 RepID=UPI00301729EC